MKKPLKEDFIVYSVDRSGFIDMRRYNRALEDYIELLEAENEELTIIVNEQNKFL